MKISFSRLTFIAAVSFIFTSCSSYSRLKIELEGNPTTGYSWEYKTNPEQIISVKEKITYLGENGIVGAPSKFEYTLTPEKDGETDLTFVYRRSFEADSAAEKIECRIRVENGRISATGKLDGDWQIVSLKKDDEEQQIFAATLTVNRQGETLYLSGETGINVFNASLKLKQNLAKDAKDFALTKAMGSKEEVAFEDIYLQLFDGSFTIIPYVKNDKACIKITNQTSGLSAVFEEAHPAEEN